MDHNDFTNNPDWEKVLARLNGDLAESTIPMTPEEEVLLMELKQIKFASKNFKAAEVFDTQAKWNQLKDQIHSSSIKKPSVHRWFRYSAAAAVICILSFGIFYWKKIKVQADSTALSHSEIYHDIQHGGKVVLTLANGEKINLSDVENGKVAQQSGISITKSVDGKLIYSVRTLKDQKEETSVSYNSIETPKGGQYQINLPDGTQVWLNGNSTLKYPVNFAKLKERKVTLNGEAYFEVAHDRLLPFKVIVGNQEVEDIGTHFNINGYPDEERIETTLLEGAIRISDSQKSNQLNNGMILKPGQMAINDPLKTGITVANVNTANVVAWKNGYFIFNNENIKDIMKDLSRWYDFDVEYQGDMSEVQFHGNYLRSRNYLKLLKAIELTNKVEFKIEGRRVTVIAR